MCYHRSLDLASTHTLNHYHKPRQLATIMRQVWRFITSRSMASMINTSRNRWRHPDGRRWHLDGRRLCLNDRRLHPNDRQLDIVVTSMTRGDIMLRPAPTRQLHCHHDSASSSPAWLGGDITPQPALTHQRHRQHDSASSSPTWFGDDITPRPAPLPA
jgi:hypothetical protein